MYDQSDSVSLWFVRLCDYGEVDVEAQGEREAELQPMPEAAGSSASTDRLHAVFAADDLALGSVQVLTPAEREAGVPPDRSSDVFRAFGFEGGDAVLLLGVIDGAIARLLAEQVRSVVVVATEGSADLVGARCRSLSNVSVAHSVADAATRRSPFNAVLSPVGPIDPDHLVALAPVIDDATMVVWVEHNPFGFDRLLGEPTAAELVASHTLAEQQDAHDALATAGLRLRSTLYPYPTLSAPTLALAPPLFRHDNKAELFDLVSAQQVSAQQVSAQQATTTRSSSQVSLDPVAAPDELRALLLAGAARSLMPTRLVIASRVALAASRFDCAVAAWTFERHPDPIWCSMHRFVPVTADPTAGTTSTAGTSPNSSAATVEQFAERLFPGRGRAERGWLSLALADETEVPLAASIKIDLHRAAVRGDVEHIGTLLKQWRSALRSLENDRTAATGAGANPFAPNGSESRLGPEWFDARLNNVVLDPPPAVGDEAARFEALSLRLLGRRFRLNGPVSTDLVLTRAYWYLARDLLTARLPHPWSAAITVDELAQTLASHGGDRIGPTQLDRWRRAEADLLAVVTGGASALHFDRLWADGAANSAALLATVAGLNHRTELVRLRAELDSSRAEADTSQTRLVDLEQQLAAATADDAGVIEDLRAEISDLSRQRDRQDDKIEAQSRLLTEVIRKYERAVHERNMVEQGMHGYRRVVTVAKRVMPTDIYFRVRKIIRGH